MTSTASGRERLDEHVRACQECRQQPPALDLIDTVLSNRGLEVDAGGLSARVLATAPELLAANAARLFRTRVAASLLVSLMPFPALLVCGVYVLHAVYTLLARLLPDTLAAVAVAGYGATVLLLVASTYAAVPLLVAHAGTRRMAS